MAKAKHHSISTDGPKRMTEREYLTLTANDTGICRTCGNEQDGCEPDAREYPCDACGDMNVYGAEELLARGEITFGD